MLLVQCWGMSGNYSSIVMQPFSSTQPTCVSCCEGCGPSWIIFLPAIKLLELVTTIRFFFSMKSRKSSGHSRGFRDPPSVINIGVLNLSIVPQDELSCIGFATLNLNISSSVVSRTFFWTSRLLLCFKCQMPCCRNKRGSNVGWFCMHGIWHPPDGCMAWETPAQHFAVGQFMRIGFAQRTWPTLFQWVLYFHN